MRAGTTSLELSRPVFIRQTLRFWVAAGVLGLLLGASCRVVGGERGPSVTGRAYTPGAIALSNLSAQIEGAREARARRPRSTELRASLVGLLLERARFTGAASDLDDALAHAQVGQDPAPRAEQLLLEARTLAALHRFPEALERLQRAEAAGAPTERVTRERDTIVLALGPSPDAVEPILARRARAARRHPGVATWVDHAAALLALGRLDDADALLGRAAAASPDVSPLPVAWIAFQRGVLAAEQRGDPTAGEAHYREALRLVPGFVRAAVHLAELEAARGAEERARERLRGLLTSEDPEPASRLASLTTGRERAELVASARERYTALLSRHRAAYLDHALEFALAHEPPSSGRALSLARELLATRPNAKAYQLGLEAQQVEGERGAACALAAQAQPLAAAHPVLAAEIASLSCP